MEATDKNLSNRVKELILINHNRFEAYKTASSKIEDSTLKKLFTNYSLQSKQFGNELFNLLPIGKGIRKSGESGNSGKPGSLFIKVQTLQQGNDVQGILSSCESGEKETEKTYNYVLHHPQGIRNEALAVIRKQWIELHRAHFKIRIMQYKTLFTQQPA